MTDFIQFGINAIGFIVASCLLLLAVLWIVGAITLVLNGLTDWVERNGWND